MLYDEHWASRRSRADRLAGLVRQRLSGGGARGRARQGDRDHRQLRLRLGHRATRRGADRRGGLARRARQRGACRASIRPAASRPSTMTRDGQAHHVWMPRRGERLEPAARRPCRGRRRRLRSGGSAARIPASGSDLAGFGSRASCPTSSIAHRARQCRRRGQRARSCASRHADRGRAHASPPTGSGLIRGETLRVLPSPYVVRRTGYRPGLVALTFDDGPDADWTPQILDMLQARSTCRRPSSSSARMRSPTRACSTGSSPRATSSAITATPIPTSPTLSPRDGAARDQRDRAAGRGLYRARHAAVPRALFRRRRADHGGRARPALVAQQRGYLNVGLHVDTEDWQRPGRRRDRRQCASNEVLAGNEERSGKIVLLHDGGGDRAQTVAALPRIIDALRARGYRFVPTSELAGLTDAQVMPQYRGQRPARGARRRRHLHAARRARASCSRLLFFVAIALGIVRALVAHRAGAAQPAGRAAAGGARRSSSRC